MFDWSSFIPNLLATLIGAGAGVFASLRLDKSTHRRAEREKKLDEDKKLLEALRELLTIFDWNQDQLNSLINTLKIKDTYKISLQTDISSWDAIKTPILLYLNDIYLTKCILRHYSDLGHLSDAYKMYFKYFGELRLDPSKKDEGMERFMNDYLSYLVDKTPELYNNSRQIHNCIEWKIKKIEQELPSIQN